MWPHSRKISVFGLLPERRFFLLLRTLVKKNHQLRWWNKNGFDDGADGDGLQLGEISHLLIFILPDLKTERKESRKSA